MGTETALAHAHANPRPKTELQAARPIRQPRAGIFHSDGHAARGGGGGDSQPPLTVAIGEAVLDRILYQRLDGENGNQDVQTILVDADVGLQPGTQAQALDVQIGGNNLDFLGKRDQRLAGLQEVSKNFGQVQYRAACAGSLARNDAVERIQRIEQEMRIDLRLERLQFRLRDQALHFGGAEALRLL